MTNRAGQPDTEADIGVRTNLDQEPPNCFVMIAGAGSGKTTSLVKALAHLSRTKALALRWSQKIGQGAKVYSTG